MSKYYPIVSRFDGTDLGRKMDNNDVPSSAFTECWFSVTVGRDAGVGRNKADLSLGRLALTGGVFLIPCSLAKSDFKRHNGNFKAKIYHTKYFYLLNLFMKYI